MNSFQKKDNSSANQRGYAVLLATIVLTSLGLVVAGSVLLAGANFLKSGRLSQQSAQARALANACTELAIQTVAVTPTFTGPGNATFNSGTCNYTASIVSGNDRTIQATGTVGTVVRKVRVTYTTTPSLQVTEWQEVADFE
jgi:hypothetical protein